jgi:hypothetical protein
MNHLFQYLRVASLINFFPIIIVRELGMYELASESIGAIQRLVVLLAETSLILGWHMLLLLEFHTFVGESATVSKTALPCKLPISTHLCLVLDYKGLLLLLISIAWQAVAIVRVLTACCCVAEL